MSKVKTKKCSRCGEKKLLSEFHKQHITKDGYRSRCKACRREVNATTDAGEQARKRAKRWYEANRGKALAWAKLRQVEHAEELKAYKKEHYQKNKQKYIDKATAWRRENLERSRELCAKRKKEQPDRVRVDNARRRARKRKVQEKVTVRFVGLVLEFWGERCAVCGRTKSRNGRRLCLDHWIPLSKGGCLEPGNAVVLCNDCNGRKADKPGLFVFGPVVAGRIEAQLQVQAKKLVEAVS